MGAGGPSTSTQYVKSETSNLPEYAKPFYMDLMGAAKAQTLGNLNEAPVYGGQRIAPFTGQQQQVQQNILGQQTPGQFGTATGLTTAAGLGSLIGSQYTPGQFGAQQVKTGQQRAPQMQASQTGFAPDLNYFQMQGPQTFGQQQAAQYMSPFFEQALEPQLREAVFDAKRGQITEDLGAARQGTYGGSRQLIASLERERNLGQQMGDIRARGLESAFGQAQQQFERDRAAQMGVGRDNLQSLLQTQQLGTETGLRTALANLDASSQSNVQNLAAQLQTQGLNAEQSLRAALANQQSRMDAQRLAEQSRQFASQQQLAGLGQAGQMGQTLAGIGQAQQQGDLARLGQQQSTAAQTQALQQQLYDTNYQDFLRQQNYPLEQLQQYSSLLRGVPVTPNTTSTTTMPQPSIASQIMGTGLGALGAYKALG
jgi:hypothetical protein